MNTPSERARAQMQQVCAELQSYFRHACGEPMGVLLVVAPYGVPGPGRNAEWVTNMSDETLPAFIHEVARNVTLQATATMVVGGSNVPS